MLNMPSDYNLCNSLLIFISNPGKRWIIQIARTAKRRSEEHTSELQSRGHLVCRLLLEKKVEKKIKAEFEKLLNKLQKLESDAFGYGRYYKASLKGKDTTREEWREKFPEIDVKFNVNAEIMRHGTTE